MILIVVEKIAPPVRDVRLSSRDCSHARLPRFSDRVAVANKGKSSANEKRDHIWWDEARSAKFFIVEME
jgi:hypothetical protein